MGVQSRKNCKVYNEPLPLTKELAMQFIDTVNPFGTDAFTPPTTANIKVRPHRLPKTKRGTRALRSPMMPSTIIKNFLLA